MFLQSDETDVSQFDTRFTHQTPVDSPDDSALSESADRVFAVCTCLTDSTENLPSCSQSSTDTSSLLFLRFVHFVIFVHR